MSTRSLVLQALLNRRLSAKVSDVDHYRIRGGMAVETDYIITVEYIGEPNTKDTICFNSYTISKTFSSFRTLSSQLDKIGYNFFKSQKSGDSLPASVKNAINLSETVKRLVESQRTQYLGKVNFSFVKAMTKQRNQVIGDMLDSIITEFPKSLDNTDECSIGLAGAIETFFLTDFCEEEELGASGEKVAPFTAPFMMPLKLLKEQRPKKSYKPDSLKEISSEHNAQMAEPIISPVAPLSFKKRRSYLARQEDEQMLEMVGNSSKLLMDDDREQSALLPSYSNPVPVGQNFGTKAGDAVENNPFIFFLIGVGAVAVLRVVSEMTVTVDTDVAMLLLFAFFCLGFHLPRPQGEVYKPPPAKLQRPVVTFQARADSGRMLLKKTMTMKAVFSQTKKGSFDSVEEDGMEAEIIGDPEGSLIMSPLPVFPKEAELGSVYNSWSAPPNEGFQVRGPTYLADKKKVASQDFIFPCRGVDLFLTDICPENVGSNSSIMGGNLRDEPSFIINFRLPWGVLLFYFSIPEKYLPFLFKRYDPAYDDSALPSLDKMTPGERTVARFLMGDDDYKNNRLKIVPVVVKGPWVVKSVVGGKPALIGNKLPVSYVYQPAVKGKACYLEADLDIAASSAARGILSVTRSATTELTIDLGFVIQANEEDELPEQMLVGSRLHGLDPLQCPNLPPMKNIFSSMKTESSDEESL